MLPVTEFHRDRTYNRYYKEAMVNCEMNDFTNEIRMKRFWQLIQAFKAVEKLPGHTAECGCYMGLSSWLLLKYGGKDSAIHRIFDSFEGLSPPSLEDSGSDYRKGKFACPKHDVKHHLKQFDNAEFYQGWIPHVFQQVGQYSYKFVHIDVDLFQPTLDSLEYFWPLLVQGGVIVVDDYGYSNYPGAGKAVRQFGKGTIVPLLTGNCLLVKS